MENGRAEDIVAALIKRDPNGESFAERNGRRQLEAREFKALSYIRCVYAYSAFVATISQVSFGWVGRYADATTFAITFVVIASVRVHMWRHRQLPRWVLLTPCSPTWALACR
jgi:hypothetical protein